MANPYSKYTGQRVSAIPAGYLEANARAAASLQSGLASIGEAIGKYYGNKRKDEEEEKQAELDREALRFIMESDSALMDDPPEEVDERNLFSTTDIYVPQNAADPFKREEGKLVWPGEAKEHGTSEHTPEPSVMLPSARKAVVGRKTRERTPEELRDAKIELQNNNMAAFLERYLGKEGPRVSDNIVKLAMDRYDKGKQAAESEYDKAVEAGLSERRVAVSEGAEERAREKQESTEDADKKDRDALVSSLEASGFDSVTLNKVKGAGSLDGMLNILASLPVEDSEDLPANVKTWKYLESQYEGLPEDQKKNLMARFFGVEDSEESKTATQQDLDAFTKINADPDLTDEFKINAGYKLGVYSTKVHAVKFYDNWLSENSDATLEAKDKKAKDLGLTSSKEAEIEALNLKKAQAEEEDRVRAAKSRASRKAEVIEVPGASYQLVKAPGSNNYIPLRLDSDETERLVSKEEADAENRKLAGTGHKWVQDLKDPRGNYKMVSIPPWNLNRELLQPKNPDADGPETVPQNRGPVGNNIPAGALPAPDSFSLNPDGKSITDGNVTIVLGEEFEEGGKTYIFKMGRDGKPYYHQVK